MFYHKDTNFQEIHRESLRENFEKSPESDTSLDDPHSSQIRSVLGNEKTSIFNALLCMKAELEIATKISEIYGRYPMLMSTMKVSDFVIGKPVRVKTVDGENKRVIIPPFPPKLWNFFVVLCFPNHSDLEKKWRCGEVAIETPFFSESLPPEFYATVINLISTVLHKFNQRNVYPWPMMMAQLLHHPSNSQKSQLFAAMGISASDRKFHLYKEDIAALSQE